MADMRRKIFNETDWREINSRVRKLCDENITLTDLAAELENHGATVEYNERNGKYVVLDGKYKRYSLYTTDNGVFALTDMFARGELGALTGSNHPNSAYGVFNIMRFVGVNSHREVENIFLGPDARKNVIRDYSAGRSSDTVIKKPNPMRQQPESTEKEEEKKEFSMPETVGKPSVAFGYLAKERGIDYNLLCDFVKRGEIVEDKAHHNVGFVGKDDDGKPAYLQFRVPHEMKEPDAISRWNQSGSNKQFSFRMEGDSGWLYVFESPIDMLSYLTIKPQNPQWKKANSYLSLGGVDGAALRAYLSRHPDTSHVIFCLDNDEAGKAAMDSLAREIKRKDPEIKLGRDLPAAKDWNEELKENRQQSREASGPAEEEPEL